VVDRGDQQYEIHVNNTGYMTVANVSPGYLAGHPDLAREYQNSSYDSPFRFVVQRSRVLIVGAGAGNDAAAALRNGAGQVDAVEIDPVIYSLGKRLHPEQPYSSPQVHVILSDARAFLRKASQPYDVIVFGLLDSHTQFSGYSNMRIDNYVYTDEAFREAKRLLKPSGVLIVKFEVRAPWTWMGERFYSMFDHLFGRPPIVFYAPQIEGLLSATVFLGSNDPDLWNRAAQPELARMVSANPPPFPLELDRVPPPTTDDWPYVYHRGRTIPRAYLTVSLILLIMAVLLTRRTLEPAKPSTWKFFFLGAGFLLLETQLISRLALYFGATWWVNCVALSALLLVLVLANLWVHRRGVHRLGPLYAALLACLMGIYLFPWQQLLFGTRTVGILLAGAYCLPVFFAGVIFTESFRRCEGKSSSFGSNIVGAVAGGLAQNVSFIVGLKALLLLAALFYSLSGICGLLERRKLAGSAARYAATAPIPEP
jgi:spermidine synthase